MCEKEAVTVNLKELLKDRIKYNLYLLNKENYPVANDKYFTEITNMIIRDYLILMAIKEVGN